MRTLTIARLTLARFVRDRANIFFVFVFPLALVLLIGLQFGGDQTPVLAVVAPDDPVASRLVEDLSTRDGVTVEIYGTRQLAIDAVAAGRTEAVFVLPDDYAAALQRGEASVGFVTRPDGGGEALRPVVSEAVGRQAIGATAASVAAEVTGLPRQRFDRLADDLSAAPSAVTIEQVSVQGDGLAAELGGMGRFDLGASSQLVLFVFITSLTAAAGLIQERNRGLVTRMLSTPTHTRQIVLGIALGRFGVALFQGAYIMFGALLLFGVDWGHPVGALAVLAIFSAVSAGAGMLLGALASNDTQANGIGVGLGLGLAALGGSMMPLEIFPETMRRIASITPHAWANRAFADLVRRDLGPSAILPELAVLGAMAAVVLTAAVWRLRQVTLAGR